MSDFKKLSDKEKVVFAAEKINEGVSNVHEHVTSKINLGSYLPSSLIVIGILALIGAINHPGLVLFGLIILGANAIVQNKEKLIASGKSQKEAPKAAPEVALAEAEISAKPQEEGPQAEPQAPQDKPKRVRKPKNAATQAEIAAIESKES